MTSEQLAAIELADAIRYVERRRAEDKTLGCPDKPKAHLPYAHRYTHRFRAGEPRTIVHGVATIPGYTPTPAQVEDIAAGRCVDTVRVRTSEDDYGTIHTVRDFRRNGAGSQVERRVTPAQVADTARFSTGHDFTA